MEDGYWDYSSLWNETLRHIKEEISEQEFLMWFNNLGYQNSEEKLIFLSVPSSFYRDQLSQRYQSHIEAKLYELQGTPIKIQYLIKRKTDPDKKPEVPAFKSQPAKPRNTMHPQLKKEYNFENFVIGENNSFAANAAIAIARNPGQAYNPCLIYGGVGVGMSLMEHWQ